MVKAVCLHVSCFLNEQTDRADRQNMISNLVLFYLNSCMVIPVLYSIRSLIYH